LVDFYSQTGRLEPLKVAHHQFELYVEIVLWHHTKIFSHRSSKIPAWEPITTTKQHMTMEIVPPLQRCSAISLQTFTLGGSAIVCCTTTCNMAVFESFLSNLWSSLWEQANPSARFKGTSGNRRPIFSSVNLFLKEIPSQLLTTVQPKSRWTR